MSAKSLEERIKALEEDNERQKKEIQRLKDVHEIQNMMGRYIYLHEVHRDNEFLDSIFAKDDPGVSWEVANYGVFVGKEGIKRALYGHGAATRQDRDFTGTMFMHTLTTPVIEVAGDGKTAKGVWISPGHETMRDLQTGELQAYWCWTKYGCDFIKVDGNWKLWHYHVYRIFRTPFDTPWTEEHELKHAHEVANRLGGPDLPTSYDHPYTTTTEREYVPAAPEPYETFEETFSYGP